MHILGLLAADERYQERTELLPQCSCLTVGLTCTQGLAGRHLTEMCTAC